MLPLVSFVIVFLFLAVPSQGGFWDSASGLLKGIGGRQQAQEQPAKTVSDQDKEGAFRQALEIGISRAVEMASAPGGFLNNPKIRIPLPEKVRPAANMLKRVGMGSQVEALETSMNRAAEKAAGEAMPIMMDAVKQITFEDQVSIYQGGDTAITDYFKRKTWKPLYERFLPIVHENAMKVGVSRRYEELTANAMVRPMVQGTSLDLDHYVATKALEGLFTLVAQQESEIRRNPMARTTDLLKKVFGALSSSSK